MIRTDLKFEREAREKLMVGVNKLAKAVSTTLGGAGKNVMLVDNLLPPQVTKDGITVAKSITLDDFIEQAGVEIVRQASARSAKEVGDGTTTATVISAEILNRGVEVIDDLNVHDFKKGMEKAYEIIAQKLEEDSEDVSENLESLKNIATISANGDENIGETVSKLIYDLGVDSEVLILEDKTQPKGIYSQIKQGYTFARGSNPFFETSRGTGVVKYDACKIMIIDRYIARIHTLETAIDYCADNGLPLIILYSSIESKSLENLILTKMNNGVKICAVEFPDAGEMQQLSIMDIADATGAKIIKDLEQYEVEDLGDLAQFKSDAYNTTLMFDEKFKENIEEIVSNIKGGMDLFDGYKLSDAKERLKRLSKGIGEIRIGHTTDVEYREIYDRVEDAIGAVRSAMQEGIVVGGGIALLKASYNITVLEGSESEVAGMETVIESCQKPFKQILLNAGLKNSEIEEIQDKILDSKFNLGFNARTKSLENLKELGIIDPKKVTRSALLAAVSVASSILTTDCIVFPKPLSLE